MPLTALGWPLARLADDLLDFFFPRWCVVCERPPDPPAPLCTHCLERLVTLPHPVCPRCRFFVAGDPAVCPISRDHDVPPFPVWALGLFDDYYRPLIHAFKFDNRRDCGEFLAARLGMQVARDPQSATIEAVVPVPLHRARRRERGFNQSEGLARAVAHALDRPVNDMLVRTRNTKSQTALDGRHRQENVAGAFRVRDGGSPGVVLLIDDVLTTGATMRACADALVQAGAGRVFGAVVALAEPTAPDLRRSNARRGI